MNFSPCCCGCCCEHCCFSVVVAVFHIVTPLTPLWTGPLVFSSLSSWLLWVRTSLERRWSIHSPIDDSSSACRGHCCSHHRNQIHPTSSNPKALIFYCDSIPLPSIFSFPEKNYLNNKLTDCVIVIKEFFFFWGLIIHLHRWRGLRCSLRGWIGPCKFFPGPSC